MCLKKKLKKKKKFKLIELIQLKILNITEILLHQQNLRVKSGIKFSTYHFLIVDSGFWTLDQWVPLWTWPKHPLSIHASIRGGIIELCTQSPLLQVSALNQEQILFLVTITTKLPIILCFPWLRLHNPQISWWHKIITCWSATFITTAFYYPSSAWHPTV